MVRYFDGKMSPEYRVWDSEGCFVMENLISIFQHSTCACSERTLLLQKICTLLRAITFGRKLMLVADLDFHRK